MKPVFPIVQIFSMGVRMPFERANEIIRQCLPYIVVTTISAIALTQEINPIANLMIQMFTIVFGILAAVSCHRIFLLDYESVKNTPRVRWSSLEKNFLLSSLTLAFIFIALAIPVFILFGVIYESLSISSLIAIKFFVFIILIPFFYLLARCSLILPDAALGKARGIKWAWSITSRYSISLFLLLGVFPLSTNLIWDLLEQSLPSNVIVNFLENIIFLIISAIELAMLSLSYDWITKHGLINEGKDDNNTFATDID